ncbi:bifunctional DNA primase/polymerase [Synechococcus sp. CBW1002]|uniref:bifunctional DNA primase/polymerase n=1 Tax=Synechococcus sp. CBW1002 TaxID=1353134 RepID=UPI0018CEF1CA|nr:bifunctional DNA primase/polymerase [Synechococcus sp. CBW1002]QPN60277.1 bifunctional DNA primase/polymerase [Synechococcus sp. CBW1002]
MLDHETPCGNTVNGDQPEPLQQPTKPWMTDDVIELVFSQIAQQEAADKAHAVAEHLKEHPWKDKQLLKCEGLALLPIGADKIPVKPGFGHHLKEWQLHSDTPQDIQAQRCKSTVAVGFRPGPDSGDILCIDVDGADCMELLEERGCRWEDVGWAIGRDNTSDRRKAAFWVEPDMKHQLMDVVKGKPIGHKTWKITEGDKEQGVSGQQIELFYGSGQCVILGKHGKSGGNYTWQGDPTKVNEEPVAHRSAPSLSTAAHQSAQISVTAMDLGDTLGHAEAQDLSPLAAAAGHPAAAVTA